MERRTEKRRGTVGNVGGAWVTNAVEPIEKRRDHSKWQDHGFVSSSLYTSFTLSRAHCLMTRSLVQKKLSITIFYILVGPL